MTCVLLIMPNAVETLNTFSMFRNVHITFGTTISTSSGVTSVLACVFTCGDTCGYVQYSPDRMGHADISTLILMLKMGVSFVVQYMFLFTRIEHSCVPIHNDKDMLQRCIDNIYRKHLLLIKTEVSTLLTRYQWIHFSLLVLIHKFSLSNNYMSSLKTTTCDALIVSSDNSVYIYIFLVFFKSPEHGLGINMEKIWTIPKRLNNCVIEHNQYVPCASFEETCAQTWQFQYTIHYEGKSFSCPRTQKEFTS